MLYLGTKAHEKATLLIQDWDSDLRIYKLYELK